MSLSQLDRSFQQDTPRSPRAAAPLKGGFSREPLMPLRGATTDENNRPLLDKGGLQGGRVWKFRQPPPDPLLVQGRGTFIFRGVILSAPSVSRISITKSQSCRDQMIMKILKRKFLVVISVITPLGRPGNASADGHHNSRARLMIVDRTAAGGTEHGVA